MTRLIVRPDAEVDIADAAIWYERQETGLGERLLDELRAAFGRLQAVPLQFPEVSGSVRRALLLRFPYSIYFVAEESRVVVLAVLHQRRNPRTWARARRSG